MPTTLVRMTWTVNVGIPSEHLFTSFINYTIIETVAILVMWTVNAGIYFMISPITDAVDSCAGDPCKDDVESECWDTFDDFFCQCSPGKYGKRCEKSKSSITSMVSPLNLFFTEYSLEKVQVWVTADNLSNMFRLSVFNSL